MSLLRGPVALCISVLGLGPLTESKLQAGSVSYFSVHTAETRKSQKQRFQCLSLWISKLAQHHTAVTGGDSDPHLMTLSSAFFMAMRPGGDMRGMGVWMIGCVH